MIVIVLLPLSLYIVVAYACKINEWQNPMFEIKYGALLEGVKQDRDSWRGVVLFIPAAHFVRRIIFAATIVFWYDFFWGQIACQFAVSTIMIIFLQWFRPLDTKFANKIETFNEVSNVVTFYILMCFSDYVGKADTRSTCGVYFIVYMSLFIAVHKFLRLVKNKFMFKL